MSLKVAMIGAGSVVFSKNLTGDFLQHDAFSDATFTYMDVDERRLQVGAGLCRKVAEATGTSPTIQTTMDQAEAVDEADFVVCMVQIGGFNSTLVDFEIPRKYGLNFTIADTTGPGGLFRALRTQPFMASLARDIADRARPGCWLLQYSNPMSMNLRALLAAEPTLDVVGLCHSVQGTLAALAADLQVPADECRFTVAGINHMAFFTELSHRGRDLYPELFDKAAGFIDAGHNAVRYELMRRLGYFVTESSEHNAEYCAHFMPHESLIDRFGIPVDEYLRRCDGIVDEFARLVDFSKTDEPIDVKTSHEYGSVIAHSIATGEPSVVYGNLPNRGAIPNLPDTAIVETPTLVDRNGPQPTRVAPLEPQLLGYVMPHVVQHELFARAVTERDRDAVYQACFNDPLTAATLPMDTIVEMCDELIAAQQGDLPPLEPGRLPGSGKAFDPPTAEALRASWDEAKKHTSDEDAVDRWELAGPFDKDADVDPLALDGDADWKPVGLDAGDQVQPTEALSTHADGHYVARASFDSVHDRQTTARFNTARWRPAKVYLNGELIYEGDGAKDVPLTLRQGRNDLAVRLTGPTAFGLYVTKANF